MDNTDQDASDEAIVQKMFPKSFQKYVQQSGGNGAASPSPGAAPAPPSMPQGGGQPPTPEAAAPAAVPAASGEPDATDYSNKSWGEVGKEAIQNAPGSALKLGKGIASTVLHPVTTLENLGQIGSGLASKAEGALGVEQDPQAKADAEKMVDAIGGHYKSVYGGLLSGDTSGLKKEIATDPMSPLMDAATVLTGGETALAKAPGMLGKAGELAGAAGSAIDPMQNAMRVAKIAAKPLTYPIKKVVPMLQAGATGVPKNMLAMASQAATTKNPAFRDSFQGAMSGSITPGQTNDIIRNALDGIQSSNSQAYWAGKQQLGTQPLDWTPVTNALTDARKITRKTDANGQTMIVDPKGDSILDDIESEIKGDGTPGNGLMNAVPGSTFHTAEGFDALKQKIGHLIYDRQVSGKTRAAVSGIYNGIKQSITDVYPDYQQLMEDTQQRIMDTKDLLAQAGKDSIPATKQFAKVMLSTRKGDDTLLQALTKQDGRIPYLLAGHSMADWLPNRFRTAIESPFALLAAMHNPSLLPGFVAASPKAMGKLNYGVAKASTLPSKLTTGKGVALEQLGHLNNQTATGSIYAKGGRIGRKTGGRVDGMPLAEVARHADRLVSMVDRVRKGESKGTEPLLKMDDSAVAHALEMVNRGI